MGVPALFGGCNLGDTASQSTPAFPGELDRSGCNKHPNYSSVEQADNGPFAAGVIAVIGSVAYYVI